MNITQSLREAIWSNADRGFAVVHIPKAAGTSIRTALERRIPFVSLGYLSLAHSPGCRCRLSECRFARRHEERFLRSVQRGQPWCLHLWHSPLSHEALADIPSQIPILVPLRSSGDRLRSYFRYYWTMAEFAQSSTVVATQKRLLSWNLRAFRSHANIPLWSSNPRLVGSVQDFRILPRNYLMDDLRTINVQRWLDDALAPGSDPFLYIDYLPGMKGTDDIRWSRLMRIHLSELVDAFPKEWGVSVGRRNVSRSELKSVDFAAATQELDHQVDQRVRSDADLWGLLSQDTTSSAGLNAIGLPRALGQVT